MNFQEESTMEEKTFKLWYDEKEGVLRSEIYKKFDVETLEEYFNEVSKFTPEQQRYIIGWVFCDAQKMPDKEARRVAKEKFKSAHFKIIANLGAKPVIRMVSNIVMTAVGQGKDNKYFETEEEALAWIRAEKEKDKKGASPA